MPANDPQVLIVKNVPDAPTSRMDYNFFCRTVDRNGNPLEKPASLCGISFFGEIGGYDPAATTGIELWGSQDTNHPPAYKCPTTRPHPVGSITKYGLTYETYLNALYNNGLCEPPTTPRPTHINYLRLFLLPSWGQAVYPFERVSNTDHRFKLHVINDRFMNRLSELVEKARARGVVVCISLTSIQAIKTEGWLKSPFYYRNNVNQLERWTSGLSTFCKPVRPKEYDQPANPWPGVPECFDPDYNPQWTPPEKLYFIQHQLFRRVVEATRHCWNVVYEISNEADSTMEGVVEWHTTVADWLNNCLREDLETPRRRLISMAPKNDILSTLVNTLKGKVDFISLHGGQWTNDPPIADNRCNTTAIPTPDVVASKVQAVIDRYRGKGFALLYDADAAYWAQRSPKRYVKDVLGRGGSFNYRWPPNMSTQVADPDTSVSDYCKPVNGNFGLDQRIDLIIAAEGFDTTVTPFPLPAAAVPKNLAAVLEAGALKLTFGRPARPTNPKDPDTKPEGYVVFYGATEQTVGQGAELLPPRQYFQVQNPESPQLSIPIVLTWSQRELYVAVAAYNGPFVGERSNVAHVTLPAGVLGAEMVAAQLPFGAGAKVPTRFISGTVTFKNTGTAAWKKQTPIPDGTSTCGIYLQSQDLWTDAGRFFFPQTEEYVLPGQTTTIQLSNVRLPYWRQAQHFKIGMGLYRVSTGGWAWGHFGTVYDRLPSGAPVEVEVSDPKRFASLLIDRTVTLPPNAPYVDPKALSSTPDYRSYDVISCITTARAASGTVIRWRTELRNVNGQTTRVAVVSHDAAVPLGLSLKVVRLDNRDIEATQHPDTKVIGFNLAPRSQQLGSLTRFQNLYSVTAGTSTSPLPVGASQSLRWDELLSAANPPVKQLRGENTSDAQAQLTAWTNEIWENVLEGQTDPRQLPPVTLSFAANESVKYVRVSDAARHRVHLAWLMTGGGAEVRHAFVLRANAQGVFERALEITLGPHAQTVQVTYHVLDVFIDTIG